MKQIQRRGHVAMVKKYFRQQQQKRHSKNTLYYKRTLTAQTEQNKSGRVRNAITQTSLQNKLNKLIWGKYNSKKPKKKHGNNNNPVNELVMTTKKDCIQYRSYTIVVSN